MQTNKVKRVIIDVTQYWKIISRIIQNITNTKTLLYTRRVMAK